MSFVGRVNLNNAIRLATLMVILTCLIACQKQATQSELNVSNDFIASGHAAVQSTAPTKKKTIWVEYPKQLPLSQQAQLGKQIFFDASLSASGKMSCATCHDPNHAHAPSNDLAVQLGGEKLDQAGTRAVPSLRYLTFTPLFTRHYYLPSPEGLEDEGAAGGFTQDGAVNTLHEQAAVPLLMANEMANVDAAAVAKKIQSSAYARQFQQIFGDPIFDDPKITLEKVGLALEAFQTEDASFHPYTSKFDAVVSGNAEFTEAQWRGYRAFKDPNKGNCAECHVDSPGPGGRPAQFTDYAYEAIGVPRNLTIPANRNKNYYDMGLCGPFRQDLQKETEYCGMFKTPTLRNVATRKVFFHNGAIKDLTEAVRFYVERDSHPQKWYPKRNGKVQIYDDLPKKYHDNIDHVNPPFNRKKGEPAALSETEIQDLVEFLKTLNDGYSQTAGGE